MVGCATQNPRGRCTISPSSGRSPANRSAAPPKIPDLAVETRDQPIRKFVRCILGIFMRRKVSPFFVPLKSLHAIFASSPSSEAAMISCCPSEPTTRWEGALAARPPSAVARQPTTDPSGSRANSANWSRNGLRRRSARNRQFSVKAETADAAPRAPIQPGGEIKQQWGASMPGGNAANTLRYLCDRGRRTMR